MELSDADTFSHTFLLGGEADLPTLRAIRGPEAETRKKRAHRKSRWGCAACKRRKVKVRTAAASFFLFLLFFLAFLEGLWAYRVRPLASLPSHYRPNTTLPVACADKAHLPATRRMTPY